MFGVDPTIVAGLRENGLLRDGHFAFRSGRHSAGLLDRDLLLSDPGFASHLGYTVAKRYFSEHVETVAAASLWGAGLAQWVGYFLEPKAKVVYALNREDGLALPENLAGMIRSKRVLLVDNLVLTGKTMERFAAAVDKQGAELLGIATLWNTSGSEIAGLPIFSLFSPVYEVYSADSCPICAGGGDAPEVVPY
jgi:orotate phosphoribosyltransferase